GPRQGLEQTLVTGPGEGALEVRSKQAAGRSGVVLAQDLENALESLRVALARSVGSDSAVGGAHVAGATRAGLVALVVEIAEYRKHAAASSTDDLMHGAQLRAAVVTLLTVLTKPAVVLTDRTAGAQLPAAVIYDLLQTPVDDF